MIIFLLCFIIIIWHAQGADLDSPQKGRTSVRVRVLRGRSQRVVRVRVGGFRCPGYAREVGLSIQLWACAEWMQSVVIARRKRDMASCGELTYLRCEWDR